LKKRVIHIVNDLVIGGVTTIISDLLKNYKHSDYHQCIVCLTDVVDQKNLEQFRLLGVEIIFLKYSIQQPNGLTGLFKMSLFEFFRKKKNQSVISAIASLKPDIINFHTLPTELYLGRGVSEKHPCILLYTDHSTRLKISEMKYFSALLIKWPYILFYKNYNVIAVSHSVKNYIFQFKINKSLKSITVITNKINGNKLRITNHSKTSLNLVYVSRISNLKGHEELIEAYREFPPLGLILYIVGPDNLNGEIKELASKVINNKVVFTGSINNVKEFILNMDIGLFPSHKEGLPISLLEKMQVGLPCIVSDIEELTSVIKDEEDGLVFKKGDKEDLKIKILKLIYDSNLRKKLGQNAALKIENQFVSKIGGLNNEYENLYSQILKQSSVKL
jgi:glycosyltransferase involved in cell wall biosynthesis